MKVFKFGGASVKDANSVMNLTKILKSEGSEQLVMVISAMGKMTNALEQVIEDYHTKSTNLDASLATVKAFHLDIVDGLFDSNHHIYKEIDTIFEAITQFFKDNTNFTYDYIYDQIVIYGELLSTKIVSHYFHSIGIENIWLDARMLIETDTTYRDAQVNWENTSSKCRKAITKNTLYITQGFMAQSNQSTNTTLGREGSDYSAAIISYCLEAESLTIWKDVPGVYNADPRFFDDKIVLKQISYREALEMAFYGASIIHPKTIKPLENKNIPLFVNSFVQPNDKGTIIKKGIELLPKVACYTHKKNQILLSIATKDFSFIIEKNISYLFDLFATYQIKVNLIQNSAISFSVCIEDPHSKFDALYKQLISQFTLTYNKGVQLISIRHFSADDILKIKEKHHILLTQQTTKTIQFIIK